MHRHKKLKRSSEHKFQLLDFAYSGAPDKFLTESVALQSKMQGVGYKSIFQAKIRDTYLLKMERLLYIWIADLNQKRMTYDESDIEVKALSLYKDLQILEEEEATDWFPFIFNRGWFPRLKQQTGVHSLRLFGDSDGADTEAAAKYPEELSEIIKKGKYKDEQIFNVDDISFFWKKLPSHTYLVSDENSCRGSKYFKTSNEQLTILLGGNAAGDFKLKPLIVCPCQNTRSFNEDTKNDVIVIANKLAWLTKIKFEEWFTNYFCPATERYCQAKGLEHNILLILDNAPGHKLNVINNNVQVTYIPPNTAPLLQPMDQGIFSIFKAIYMRRIFSNAVKETSAKNGPSMVEYWNNYNINNAVQNISKAWDKLTANEMRAVWKHILPKRDGNDDDFNLNSNLIEIAKNIVDLGHLIGFPEDLDPENVLECINLDTIELDNEVLIDMRERDPNELTFQQLERIILKAKSLMSSIKIDSNKERSSLVIKELKDSICCYNRAYELRKLEKANQE